VKEGATVRHPAWSVASLALSAALLLFTVSRIGPRPESERALEAFEAWRVARLARDFDAVYEWTSMGAFREEMAWVRESLAGGRNFAMSGYHLELLDRADLPPGMQDTRRLFTGVYRAGWPWQLEEEETWLRALVVDQVEVEGEAAWVRGEEPVQFRLDREETGWKVRASPFHGLLLEHMERKLAAFLPREGVEDDLVDHLVEVGPGRPSDADLDSLTSLLRAGQKDVVVLLDPDPELVWEETIRVMDAVLGAGVIDIRFVAPSDFGSRSGPASDAVRLNGELLAGRPAGPPAPGAAARVAGRRVIGIGRPTGNR
jgi:hypothetical protein